MPINHGPAPADQQPERPLRRAGILVIPESDLERLARVRPGQRITGMQVDPMRQAVLLRVEGDGLPEVVECLEPPFVDSLRYQAPPLVERVDVAGLNHPADQHATVQRALLELIEHAGHLGAATGVVPDLSVNAHAAWIGAHEIVRRHAPERANNGDLVCARCRVDHGYPDQVAWPCPDYRAAAQGAVFGMEVPSDD